jgi:thioredoxin-related protein
MKNIFLVFAFLTASFSMIAQTEESANKFDPTKNPFDDLKITIEKAQQSNKRIILDVGGEWCIWCHRIDAFIENYKEIKSLIEKHFVVLKINYSKENKNEEFLSGYPEVQGYPHFFVLDKNGKLLHSQNTGELEKDKDYDAEKFIAFLTKWGPAH